MMYLVIITMNKQNSLSVFSHLVLKQLFVCIHSKYNMSKCEPVCVCVCV